MPSPAKARRFLATTARVDRGSEDVPGERGRTSWNPQQGSSDRGVRNAFGSLTASAQVPWEPSPLTSRCYAMETHHVCGTISPAAVRVRSRAPRSVPVTLRLVVPATVQRTTTRRSPPTRHGIGARICPVGPVEALRCRSAHALPTRPGLVLC